MGIVRARYVRREDICANTRVVPVIAKLCRTIRPSLVKFHPVIINSINLLDSGDFSATLLSLKFVYQACQIILQNEIMTRDMTKPTK